MKEHQKAVFFCKKENLALSEHTCLTNHIIEKDNSKIITTNRCYHQHLCLEAWHINSAHALLNRDDCGSLPEAYLHLVRKKGQLISEHVKGPLVPTIRSPLMKALDRGVETLGPWIVTYRLPAVHFTIAGLVAKPLNRSEAEGDLVMIQTLLLFKCKWLFYHAK